jgi:hypothetical protein
VRVSIRAWHVNKRRWERFAAYLAPGDGEQSSAGCGGAAVARAVADGEPMSSDSRDRPLYEIVVRGHLGETMVGAFPDLRAEVLGHDTILRGVLRDQAELHGVLAQIGSLGLELLEVRRTGG